MEKFRDQHYQCKFHSSVIHNNSICKDSEFSLIELYFPLLPNYFRTILF